MIVIVFQVGNTSTLTGVTSVLDDLDSTSTETGALTVVGGIGVGKAGVFGGALRTDDTTVSSSVVSGSLVAKGGMGIAGAANIGGKTSISDATDASSTTSASLVTMGGLGVAQATYLGGDVKMLSALDVTGQTDVAGVLSVQNTTDASRDAGGVITASINTLGGLGVTKAAQIGGTVVVSDSTESTTYLSGSVTTAGGMGVAKNVNVGGDVVVHGSQVVIGALNVTYGLKVSNYLELAGGAGLEVGSVEDVVGTGDTSLAAALLVQGGLGVVKSAVVGGTLSVWNTSEATATNVGAVTVSGGVGVAKNLHVGGNVVSSSFTTAAGVDMDVSSGGGLTLSSYANEALKLQQDVFDRIAIGTLGQIEMISAPGQNITVNSLGGVDLMAANGYSAKMSQGNVTANFVEVADNGVTIGSNLGTSIRALSGGSMMLETAAASNLEVVSGKDVTIQSNLYGDLNLKVGQYETILKANSATGAVDLTTNKLNGATNPFLTMSGTGMRLGSDSGHMAIQGDGIDIYACDCTGGVCTTDCGDATLKGNGVTIQTLAENAQLQVKAAKTGGSIEILAKDGLELKAQGNTSAASAMTIIAGHDIWGAFTIQQEQYISYAFSYFQSNRFEITTDGAMTLSSASSQPVTFSSDASTGNEIRFSNGNSHYLRKTVTMSGWTTVATITLQVSLHHSFHDSPFVHASAACQCSSCVSHDLLMCC